MCARLATGAWDADWATMSQQAFLKPVYFSNLQAAINERCLVLGQTNFQWTVTVNVYTGDYISGVYTQTAGTNVYLFTNWAQGYVTNTLTNAIVAEAYRAFLVAFDTKLRALAPSFVNSAVTTNGDFTDYLNDTNAPGSIPMWTWTGLLAAAGSGYSYGNIGSLTAEGPHSREVLLASVVAVRTADTINAESFLPAGINGRWGKNSATQYTRGGYTIQKPTGTWIMYAGTNPVFAMGGSTLPAGEWTQITGASGYLAGCTYAIPLCTWQFKDGADAGPLTLNSNWNCPAVLRATLGQTNRLSCGDYEALTEFDSAVTFYISGWAFTNPIYGGQASWQATQRVVTVTDEGDTALLPYWGIYNITNDASQYGQAGDHVEVLHTNNGATYADESSLPAFVTAQMLADRYAVVNKLKWTAPSPANYLDLRYGVGCAANTGAGVPCAVFGATATITNYVYPGGVGASALEWVETFWEGAWQNANMTESCDTGWRQSTAERSESYQTPLAYFPTNLLTSASPVIASSEFYIHPVYGLAEKPTNDIYFVRHPDALDEWFEDTATDPGAWTKTAGGTTPAQYGPILAGATSGWFIASSDVWDEYISDSIPLDCEDDLGAGWSDWREAAPCGLSIPAECTAGGFTNPVGRYNSPGTYYSPSMSFLPVFKWDFEYE